MNPYLKAQREKYEALRTNIEGLQTRAASEGRDLTDDELRSVREQGETAKGLAEQISDLTEIENRSAAVAALQVQTAPAAPEATETRTSTTTTQDRDPGHYTRSSSNSFFADLHHARSGDEDASRRLAEHNRALSTGTHGAGVVPPKWLTEEFAEVARQGRRVASVVRNIPLGDDPRPLTLPKQTAGVDTAVAEQSAENAATTFPDLYNTGVDTVTPKATVGGAKVSRQMLDMSNPAIDQLIYGDLLAAYNQKVEAKVVATMDTAAGTAVKTYATLATAWAAALTVSSGKIAASADLLAAAIAVRNARKLPADIAIMSVVRYGDYLGLTDSSGRPIMPLSENGPSNVVGTGSPAVDGRIHGLGVIASDGITQFPESIIVARSQDTLLFESNMLRFMYEQPDGPEMVRLGIWGYTACLTRYAGASTKRNVITAA